MSNVVTRNKGGASPTPNSGADNARKFFRDTWVELRWKCTWLNRQELAKSTTIVVIATIVVGFYLAMVDIIVKHIMNFLIR